MTVKRNQVASSNSSPHVYPRLAEGSPEAGELRGPNDALSAGVYLQWKQDFKVFEVEIFPKKTGMNSEHD